jgi:hypothetical protein
LHQPLLDARHIPLGLLDWVTLTRLSKGWTLAPLKHWAFFCNPL